MVSVFIALLRTAGTAVVDGDDDMAALKTDDEVP